MGSGSKCAIYMRVSKDDQDPANQEHVLARMAEVRGYQVVRSYSERMSGTKKARPALTQLIEGANRGEYEIVLVWALDRLGRSMSAIVDLVLSLDRVGVRVVSQQESWLDTSGPVRPLLLSIFAWVAQQERDRIVARTVAGLARARAEGKVLGRPRVEVDLDSMVALRKKGHSYSQIAMKLGVAKTTVQRAMKSQDVPDSVRGRLGSVADNRATR